jgi:hypothetical protein
MGGKIWKAVRRRVQDERGATLVIAAGSMIAITSVAALAIDVGMLVTARTEAQRVADSAALAGAGALVFTSNADLARLYAIQNGALNRIRGEPAVILPEDVTVDLLAKTVTVRAARTVERGNAIGTFFARIFGVEEVDIAAVGKAKASPAGGIPCPLPVAVPDRWHEAGGPGNDPNTYDPQLGDEYIPWIQPGTDPPQFNENYSGYAEADLGTEIALKSNDARAGLNPSWYYPWRPPDQAGADDYRTNVATCVDPSMIVYVGMEVDTEPGNMSGPTMQGFRDLIDQDPSASWNAQLKCVVDSGLEYSTKVTNCRSSPRIRPVPLFDPSAGPETGTKPFTFTNFAGLFVERIQGKTVYARWMGYTGIKPAGPEAGTTAGPLFKVIQLVK